MYHKDYHLFFHPVLHTQYNQEYINPIDNAIGMSNTIYGNTYVEFVNSYLGTSSIETLEEITTDNLDGATGSGILGFDNARLVPYEEAHGMVWKVELNDIVTIIAR